jgi:hypothetical protein
VSRYSTQCGIFIITQPFQAFRVSYGDNFNLTTCKPIRLHWFPLSPLTTCSSMVEVFSPASTPIVCRTIYLHCNKGTCDSIYHTGQISSCRLRWTQCSLATCSSHITQDVRRSTANCLSFPILTLKQFAFPFRVLN